MAGETQALFLPSMMIRYVSVLFLLILLSCGDSSPEKDTAVTQSVSNSGDPGIDQITSQLVDNPDRADLYAARAEMQFQQSNYDGAIVDLQRAIGLDSLNLGYYYTLADVFMEYFRSRQAINTLQTAVGLDPDQAESWLRLGEAQLITRQYDEALSSLNEVTRIDPRNPDAYLILGQVFIEQEDTTRAINATQEAVEIEPDLVDGWIKLGQLNADLGNERAEDYLQTALALDTTDVIAISALAEFYWQKADRPEEALDLYRKAARIDRQYTNANYNAGLMLMEMGRTGEALDEFNIVIQNDPLNIQGHFYKGLANEMLGNIDQARTDYRNALRMAPEYTLALEGMARVGNE
ncbi:MAG: tetratricopeptide repeat protein [Bacteroidota bacterium]